VGRVNSRAALALLALVVGGCGGSASSSAGAPLEEDQQYGLRDPSALATPTPEPVARLASVRGVIMDKMPVRIVYIGRQDVDGAPPFDPFVTWLVQSHHWETLAEYGVGPGSFEGWTRVATERFFPPGSVVDGRITVEDFEELARAYMPASSRGAGFPRGGAEASLAPDATAYVFFLPKGVDVTLGQRGSYTYATCIDALGYHRFNGREPYAVIGGCAKARTGFIVSHEVAEMATAPIVGQGWQSAEDLAKSGGEVADLCKGRGPAVVEGWSVARLWSNAHGGCVPR
jgi:hypothetical protein